MENKFNLFLAQKKGSASTNKVTELLVTVILVAVIGGLAFNYAGNGATGLGNATLYPSVPTWFPPIVQVFLAIGMLYIVLRAAGVGGAGKK